MPRFFYSGKPAAGQTLELPDNIVRHLNVLRCRPESTLTLFDGSGCEYPAVLKHLEKRRALVSVTGASAVSRESALDITLIQAVSAGERMDFTLQKSVELGVGRIMTVTAERSTVRLSGERAAGRARRWQEIAVSACEQCGRNTVPAVSAPCSLTEAFAALPEGGLRLLLGLNGAPGLKHFAAPQRIVLMIGPEGGWSAAEEAAAAAAGFHAVLLGPRVLRTETAGLAALSAMQTLWGDFA